MGIPYLEQPTETQCVLTDVVSWFRYHLRLLNLSEFQYVVFRLTADELHPILMSLILLLSGNAKYTAVL